MKKKKGLNLMYDYTTYSIESLWHLNDAYRYLLNHNLPKKTRENAHNELLRIKTVIHSREKLVKQR